MFFLSGFAALGFQLVWTRIFAIGIGNELASVLAVISAFFGGLTLGAWVLDKPMAKSRRPGHVYAALEGMIGIWGFVSLLAIPMANRLIFRWTGLESPDLWRWTLCFLIPFITLLPATFCMGATLPAMERAVSVLTQSRHPVSGLYAANTLGAVFGIFTAVFFLSPRLGYQTTLLVYAGLAITCSLSAFALVGLFTSATESRPENGDKLIVWRFDSILITLFFTGFIGIGYEILCTRALAQFFEDSVYTYSLLLMVYLLGTALGAWVYHKLFARFDFQRALHFLLTGLSVTCLAGTAMLSLVGSVDAGTVKALGQGRVAQFMGEFAAAAVIFFVPTLFMGATFSHLAQAAKEKSLGVGRALAVNTLGGSLAPFLFGIVSMPALGMRTSLVLLALGYCVLIRPFKSMALALAVIWIPLGAAILIPLNRVTLPEGSRLLDYREGAMANVAVLESENGRKSLKVNNRYYMGGTHLDATERLKSHLPLLLHPHPDKALFIGLGTGVTFGTVVDYGSIAADGVELDPLVVKMLPWFAPNNRYPFTGRYRVFTADARRYMRASPDAYDMILADFFHPNRDGAATLYTVEHFKAIHARLNPGGIFCQWLPLYQLDDVSLRIIIRTFLEVFPHAQAYLGSFSAESPGLALVGSDKALTYPQGWFEKRVERDDVREMLAKEAIADGFRIASFFMASGKDLQAMAGDAPLNTDNHPRVMYINPGFSEIKGFTSYGRLENLLALCRHEPTAFGGLAQDSLSSAYLEKVGAVLAARDLYLRGAIADAKGHAGEALDLYLQSAATTPLFSVGYAECLMKAIDQAQEDPEGTRALLRKLVDIRPEFEDAGTLLREMFDVPTD